MIEVNLHSLLYTDNGVGLKENKQCEIQFNLCITSYFFVPKEISAREECSFLNIYVKMKVISVEI